jgi:predicted site-specific integrase-resolvase
MKIHNAATLALVEVLTSSISELEYCYNNGISLRTAHNRRKAGKVPKYFFQGKQIRYKLSDIEAFEQSQA